MDKEKQYYRNLNWRHFIRRKNRVKECKECSYSLKPQKCVYCCVLLPGSQKKKEKFLLPVFQSQHVLVDCWKNMKFENVCYGNVCFH